MSKVVLPDSLSTVTWEKHKKELGKDKAVFAKVQKELTALAQSAKAVQDAHAATPDFVDPGRVANAAAGNAALAELDAAIGGAFKKLVAAAKSSMEDANAIQSALQKTEKDLKGDIAKAVTAAIAAASTASKAAAKLMGDVNATVARERAALEAACAKLKALAKPVPTAAPARANPKAAADAKTVSALMKKSIAMLRTPKGSPVPVRFMVLQENKKIRLYLGPKPDNGLAKLKTQFDPKAKLKRIRDPKGTVVWEKGFLTFQSDILKGGLSKQIQIAIKEQTKVAVKVRVKHSDGGVDEAADAPDLTDDQLKVDAADDAERIAEGKNYEKRLAELSPQITEALKGPAAKKVKALVDGVRALGRAQKFAEAVEELDELESLLEEGDVSDGDGDDAADPGDKGVPPAKALLAKLGALRSKIDAAVKAGGAAAADIKKFADAAEAAAKTEVAENVAKANLLLNKVEQMLAAAPVAGTGGLSVQKLGVARLEWISTRDNAIKEITLLSKAIVQAFAKEAGQQAQLKEAIGKLGKLQSQLKSELDRDLDAALNAEGAARVAAAAKAKASLKAIRKFVEEDELMKNLDNNEIVKSMSVVAPMKKCLSAIEAALG